MNSIIRPLIPDLIPDWLDFFDHRAFTDNPIWKSCYCTYYQLRGNVKERFKPAKGPVKVKNRDAAVAMIKAGIINGYMYYKGDRVIGWLNANDKTLFPTLKAKEPAGEVLALMCIVIAPELRVQGVATRLLKY
ncbi:MAG: GNAT family N-acetyltransferase [Bacteroidota bacterium]